MFIQLSQLTRCPLYVSPFFSSTSCEKQNLHSVDVKICTFIYPTMKSVILFVLGLVKYIHLQYCI